MEITGVLYEECPNGVTCEGTWAAVDETGTTGKLRRVKQRRILGAPELEALGVHCEPDEFVVFTPDYTDGAPA